STRLDLRSVRSQQHVPAARSQLWGFFWRLTIEVRNRIIHKKLTIANHQRGAIMRETRATMTELRQNLADLINRAAYGGERIVLVSHGEPKAAIIGVQELRSLEELDSRGKPKPSDPASVLADADRLREEIRQWQQAHGVVAEDSVETLRRLRE